jgi:hypothetical protein
VCNISSKYVDAITCDGEQKRKWRSIKALFGVLLMKGDNETNFTDVAPQDPEPRACETKILRIIVGDRKVK